MSAPDINAGAWYLQGVGEREWDVCEPTTGNAVAHITATGDAAAASAGADAVARYLLQLEAQPGE